MKQNGPVQKIATHENTIESVHASAAYEVAAGNIRRAIALGRFLPGDKLPPERELSNQMLVSRTTIREAVRVLEGEGLIKVRRGATGGLIVMRPARLSTNEMGSYLEVQLDRINSILDFRIANECFAAKWAAERRTQPQLDLLEKCVTAMNGFCAESSMREDVTNISSFFAADAEFHLTIAEASQNEMIVKAVGDAHAAMFVPIGRVFKRLENAANSHHEAIFSAIKEQDGQRAAKEIELHIEETRKSLINLLPPPDAISRA